jgi:hypothetical protein
VIFFARVSTVWLDQSVGRGMVNLVGVMVDIDDYQNNRNILSINSMVYETIYTLPDPFDPFANPDSQ